MNIVEKLRKNFSIVIFIIIFGIIDCASYSREVRMQLSGAAYCVSSNVIYKGETPTISQIREFMNDPLLRSRYSPKAIKLAAVYGFAPELKRHLELKLKLNKENKEPIQKDVAREIPSENKKDLKKIVKVEEAIEIKSKPNNLAEYNPEIKELEVHILKRFNLITIDINSLASEMNCYIDRFTEILAMMTEKEDDIVNSNTIFAIMSGAIAAIIDGLTIYDNNINQKIIISGGLLVSYFSYMAFRPMVTVEFRPKSTNLKDIWNNPDKTDNYSTAMWFLMTKKINEDDEPPYRELLIKRWVDNNFLGEAGEEREEMVNLFFGKGGISSITNLYNRREMITQLRTIITLYEQDARALLVEFMKD